MSSIIILTNSGNITNSVVPLEIISKGLPIYSIMSHRNFQPFNPKKFEIALAKKKRGEQLTKEDEWHYKVYC